MSAAAAEDMSGMPGTLAAADSLVEQGSLAEDMPAEDMLLGEDRPDTFRLLLLRRGLRMLLLLLLLLCWWWRCWRRRACSVILLRGVCGDGPSGLLGRLCGGHLYHVSIYLFGYLCWWFFWKMKKGG